MRITFAIAAVLIVVAIAIQLANTVFDTHFLRSGRVLSVSSRQLSKILRFRRTSCDGRGRSEWMGGGGRIKRADQRTWRPRWNRVPRKRQQVPLSWATVLTWLLEDVCQEDEPLLDAC